MQGRQKSFKYQKIGMPDAGYAKDFFHTVMRMSWLGFVLLFIFVYLMINSFFASLYLLAPGSISNAQEGSFWDAFVFSFQTSSTIGYGYFVPKTAFAHVIVLFDTISGILLTAIATGIALLKFSRPVSRVLFSESILINTMDDVPTLSFRIANARSSEIVDARMNLVVTRLETNKEGYQMRRIYDLNLVRAHTPLFSLSWTAMHEITETSPLYKVPREELQTGAINFIVSMTGIDDVYSQTVYDRHIYYGDQVIYGSKFKDIIETNSKGEQVVDYNKFHEIEHDD